MRAAWLAAVPLLGWLWLGLSTPLTGWGWLYGVGVAALLAGGWLALVGMGRPGLALVAVGLLLLLATGVTRVAQGSGTEQARLVTLPDGGETSWLNKVVPERDAVLLGLRLLRPLGWVSAREAEGAASAFRASYARQEAALGSLPSPVVRTVLGLQQPERFDAVLVEPREGQPHFAVLFLHGFGGNATQQCWLLAEAVRDAGGLTLCPSVGISGAWWRPDGAATVRASLDFLHARGMETIVLAGLSNGGVGASRLAPELAPELAGLILISGLAPDAPPSELPLLVIHSDRDERFPLSATEPYLRRAAADGTLARFVGDHFVLLKEGAAVRATVRQWLAKQVP